MLSLTTRQYAGMYIPYFADYIYSHAAALDLKLQGFWISDRMSRWHDLDASG
jgi:carboxypeptidase D